MLIRLISGYSTINHTIYNKQVYMACHIPCIRYQTAVSKFYKIQ